ncbi:MAG: hypothetical protein HYW78_00930 [Parcubacteria group bacterium]|nr:hypothetical protein [Parcubacteria group bacterium]
MQKTISPLKVKKVSISFATKAEALNACQEIERMNKLLGIEIFDFSLVSTATVEVRSKISDRPLKFLETSGVWTIVSSGIDIVIPKEKDSKTVYQNGR